MKHVLTILIFVSFSALADGPPVDKAATEEKQEKRVQRQHKVVKNDVKGLRENLKPQVTGDPWLDGILKDWSDFALDSVDYVIESFDPDKITQQPPSK